MAANDVDEMLLDHASTFLVYVKLDSKQRKRLTRLDEIPKLLVQLFELLMTETIDEDQKPFTTLQERAMTLQTIIDTLEQTLHLPMSHISGVGLAKLDRRQLSDALQIFDGLVQHCFSTDVDCLQHSRDSPADGRLTLSQLGSPAWGFLSSQDRSEAVTVRESETCTPPVSNVLGQGQQRAQINQQYVLDNNNDLPVRDDIGKSPIATVFPLQDHLKRNIITDQRLLHLFAADHKGFAPITIDASSFASSRSSTTIAKELYRRDNKQNQSGQRQFSRNRPTDAIRNNPNLGETKEAILMGKVFENRLPSLTMFSPKNASNVNKSNRSKTKTDQDNIHNSKKDKTSLDLGKQHRSRFEPYRSSTNGYRRHKEYDKSVNSNGKELNIINSKPVKSSFRCKEPYASVFSPIQKSKSDLYTYVSQNEHPGCVQTIRSKSRAHSKTTEHKTYNKVLKSVSTKALKKPPVPSVRKPSVKSFSQIKTRTKSKSERKTSERHVSNQSGYTQRERKNDPNSHYKQKVLSPVKQVDCRAKHSQNSVPSHSRRPSVKEARVRRPSVLSTKVQRHSSIKMTSPVNAGRNTSNHVQRGVVDSQTVSLCSSLKLLEEFDYVRRRLREIQKRKQEHLDAIAHLEQEEVRLEYVLTHVHQQSRKSRSTART